MTAEVLNVHVKKEIMESDKDKSDDSDGELTVTKVVHKPKNTSVEHSTESEYTNLLHLNTNSLFYIFHE